MILDFRDRILIQILTKSIEMSSRALRKLQREKEQQNQLNASQEDNATDDESGEEPPARKVLNAFDMLNQDEDEDEANDSDVAEPDDGEDVLVEKPQVESSEKPKPKSKSKKKKNKKKGKAPEQADTPAKGSQATAKGPQLDEIDLALKSLSTTSKNGADVPPAAKIDEANLHLYRLLAVESKHLNALNEMKRLFGNVVLENEDEAGAAAGPPRRRGRVQNLDLGGALAGRHSPASRGQGLAGLALRRNPFILGKEEWPKATSGGLGMELVEKLEDGTSEFRFVHNTIYQDVQRQFETCVESMDPQRMIGLLQYNRKPLLTRYRQDTRTDLGKQRTTSPRYSKYRKLPSNKAIISCLATYSSGHSSASDDRYTHHSQQLSEKAKHDLTSGGRRTVNSGSPHGATSTISAREAPGEQLTSGRNWCSALIRREIRIASVSSWTN